MGAQEANPSWPVKYRPRKFKELIGQHEAGLLKHIVNDEACPPVFMFCGSPGVGKTSAARIVAAALNCTEKDGKEPCGECLNCESVIKGSSYFVTEIDAASFGGADDLRSIREQTFISVGANKNIFIIDEAHSISWQGWNVLLKTFEEPNPDVYFILVTSEPNKVPLKIRTRALRFDFTKVPPYLIRERILEIGEAEGYDLFSDNTIDLIVDASNGSMREAIKLLQQFIFSDNELVNKDYALEFMEAVVKNDKAETLMVVNQWWDAVGDMRDIIEMLGNLMEKVFFIRHNLPVYCSESTKSRLVALEDGIFDSAWSAVMEVLAEWAYRDGSKAHLLFLVSQIFKAVYGSALRRQEAATPVDEAKDKPLSGDEVENMLQGLEI